MLNKQVLALPQQTVLLHPTPPHLFFVFVFYFWLLFTSFFPKILKRVAANANTLTGHYISYTLLLGSSFMLRTALILRGIASIKC